MKAGPWGDPLSDSSPLINAASSYKLRLVRLLVEGGAQVNRCNPRGETALLAACKVLRGEPAGPETVKLLTYLLQNKADPNAQDRAGRTALMYACMQRAGPHVASTLLAAGADPSMEDHSGASALVYAINAQHQPTLKVLMAACQARGCDIIIITTETDVNGSPVTRRYLNVPPSPDNSPVSCMSPSDIVIKTGSPNSPGAENIFNFRGTSNRGSSSSSGSGSGSGDGNGRLRSSELSPLNQCRQRQLSEPWLAIHSLACLNQAYKEATREQRPQEERDGGSKDEEGEGEEPCFYQSMRDDRHVGENHSRSLRDFLPRISQSVLSLTDFSSSLATSKTVASERCITPGTSTPHLTAPQKDPLPVCHLRRNTLPSVTVDPPLLHLPPLVKQSDPHLQVPTQVSSSKRRSMMFLPHPPNTSPPSSSPRSSARPVFLPPLTLASSVSSLCGGETSARSLRRHSVQLEQIGGGGRGGEVV